MSSGARPLPDTWAWRCLLAVTGFVSTEARPCLSVGPPLEIPPQPDVQLNPNKKIFEMVSAV